MDRAGVRMIQPGLGLACGKIVDGEGHIVAVEIDFDVTVRREPPSDLRVDRGW